METGVDTISNIISSRVKKSHMNQEAKNIEAEEDEVETCEFCGGKDGEHEDIETMEQVWAGEPHYAPIGSRPCPNASGDDDEYDPDADN